MTATPAPPPMPPLACPHCGAANAYGAAFCESCGKALPPPLQAGPRILYGDQAAATTAGVHVQADALRTQAKKAAQALLLVAVLTTLGAVAIGLIVFLMPPRDDRVMIIGPADAVINLIVAATFWGLYVWARRNPLPPAIVGLVLYVTLTVLQFVMLGVTLNELREQERLAAEEAGIQQPQSSVPTSPIAGSGCAIWIRVLIVVMLVQGITAGVKHRKLLKQQQQFGSAPPPGGPPGAWPQGGYPAAPPSPAGPPQYPPPGNPPM